jgi:hypothetical protein
MDDPSGSLPNPQSDQPQFPEMQVPDLLPPDPPPSGQGMTAASMGDLLEMSQRAAIPAYDTRINPYFEKTRRRSDRSSRAGDCIASHRRCPSAPPARSCLARWPRPCRC